MSKYIHLVYGSTLNIPFAHEHEDGKITQRREGLKTLIDRKRLSDLAPIFSYRNNKTIKKLLQSGEEEKGVTSPIFNIFRPLNRPSTHGRLIRMIVCQLLAPALYLDAHNIFKARVRVRTPNP